MLSEITLADGSRLQAPGFVPKLSATPGGHRRNVPGLGQDSDAVLQALGLSPEQIAQLRARGIVQ
jgi:formyl-CoA transferase